MDLKEFAKIYFQKKWMPLHDFQLELINIMNKKRNWEKMLMIRPRKFWNKSIYTLLNQMWIMTIKFESLEAKKKELWQTKKIPAFIDINSLQLYTIDKKWVKCYIK